MHKKGKRKIKKGVFYMNNKDMITPEELSDSFTEIFKNMLEVEKQETEDIYGEFIGKLIDKNKDFVRDAEDFDVLVNCKIDRVLESYLEKILEKELGKIQDFEKMHDIIFFYKNYGFLESNVRELIILKEGSPCSSDKSRWILKSYRDFLVNDTIPDMTIGEKCYWKPKFGTSRDWMDFCESLIHLHYGKPQRYLIAICNLIGENQEILN